ncbi:MAG: SpoVA/SpoVAEb family sporulation membrane protein [bacterium]
MNNKDYNIFLKKFAPKENRLKNCIVSFVVGGLIGLSSEVLVVFLMINFGFSRILSGSIISILVVFIASLLTAMGVFDDYVSKLKCGLIIPTTGFAHSVTSSALDYKKDGLITGLGSNVFKLAGSVLLYGIISSFLLVIVRVIIGV